MNHSLRPLLLLLVFLPLANVFAQLQGSFRVTRDTVLVKTAVSPDGSTLAIARSSADIVLRRGQVELIDIKTGAQQLIINGFDGPVWGVNFSADGQTLLTASTELRDEKIEKNARKSTGIVVSELKFWDTKTGEFKRKVKLPGEDRRTLDPSWSNDGTVALIERFSSTGVESGDDYLASMLAVPLPPSVRRPSLGWSMREGVNLKLLNADTGETKVKVKSGSISYNIYQSHFGRLEQPAFSPDGAYLGVIARSEVRLWNSRTGEKLPAIKDLKGQPSAIAFSHDSRSIAVASFRVDSGVYESEISIWDVVSAKLVRKLNGKYDSVQSLQFIADSRAVLIGTLQYEPKRTVGTVKIWDLATNRLASFDVNEAESVSSVKLLPNGNTVVLHSGKNVEIWDAKSWKVRYRFNSKSDDSELAKGSRFLLSVKSVASVAFSVDGATVLGEIGEEGIKIWDARTGGVKNQLRRENSATPIAISSDGKVLASVDGSGLNIWDLTNESNQAVPIKDLNSASFLVLSRNGEQISLALENEIALVSRNSSTPQTLRGHTAPIQLLVFADKAQALISVDELGVIKVWDSTTGKLKSTITTGTSTTAVAVDPTAQLIATASEDYLISVWDVRTGSLVSKLKKHENRINALAFSPDGKLLVSGGDDRTAVLWEISTGRSRHVMKGHEMTVSSLAFSHDGKSIATGSGNAAVVLWDVATGRLDRILR